MKHLAVIVFFIFYNNSIFGQTKSADTSSLNVIIKEQAETMKQLLLKKDFRAYTKFIYPKVIEMMGGKQKMIEELEKGAKRMKAEGVDFIDVTIGEPSKIVSTKVEIQCTLPQTIEIKIPDGRIITKSTLIAISTDYGKNWFFVDTSGKGIEEMKKILPNLSGELIIPEKQQDKIFKD